MRRAHTVCIQKRPASVLTAVHAAGDADRLGALALERELGGFLDYQDGPSVAAKPSRVA